MYMNEVSHMGIGKPEIHIPSKVGSPTQQQPFVTKQWPSQGDQNTQI